MLNDTWLATSLPDDYHDLIVNMAGALHDTFGAPDVAESCEALPEQLLEQAKQLKPNQGMDPTR